MNTKEKIEVMQAWLDGKSIEVIGMSFGNTWSWKPMMTNGTDEPVWNFDLNKYRVAPTTQDWIDWSVIEDEWKYMARDKNGFIYIFTHFPVITANNEWMDTTGSHFRISNVIKVKIGNTTWDKSLVERPKGV